MNKNKLVSNLIAVAIVAMVIGYAINENKKGLSTVKTNTSESSATKETKQSAQSAFKFTASAMKDALENGGYDVRTERLKTLDAYVAKYQSNKIQVRFDIYHTSDNDKIEWVEINIDASNYIDLNNPEAPPNKSVVEGTTNIASQVYKFPFFNKESNEEKQLSEWVDSNLEKAIGTGKVIETKIGDLYFTMYGQPYMRFFEITSTPK